MNVSNTSICTERLLLRPYVPEDVPLLFPILSDAVTMKFWPEPYTHAQVVGWIERSIAHRAELGLGRMAVIEQASGAFIGDCGVMPSVVDGAERFDVGYIIHAPRHGKGFASEAAAAALGHAFRHNVVQSVVANMPHNHHASSRVAQKLGMRMVREFANQRNRGIRTLLYQITRAEYAGAGRHV